MASEAMSFPFFCLGKRIHEEIEKSVVQGDLSEWPLSPDRVVQMVRVRMVRGPEALLDKFKELRIRANVVKQVATNYIDCHVQDLASRPGVLRIHKMQRQANVQQSLHAHIVQRIDRFYPEVIYDADKGVCFRRSERWCKSSRV